jgi:hypothetical protein
MLGDIIYEQTGKISGYRVLDTEGPTIETTITGTGLINGIEVTDIVTYWSKPSSKDSNDGKTFSAEGQGIILTKDGEMATWKGYGIGRYNGRNRADRGSVFFKTSTTNGKLAFLNNKIGVFEYEADENRNTSGKIWEWK